jgi:hypothetical protein
MFELIILILAALWLVSFFGQVNFVSTLHMDGFIYMLSLLIFSLIAVKFLFLI